jgi:hypothetical protein
VLPDTLGLLGSVTTVLDHTPDTTDRRSPATHFGISRPTTCEFVSVGGSIRTSQTDGSITNSTVAQSDCRMLPPSSLRARCSAGTLRRSSGRRPPCKKGSRDE